VGQRIYFSLQQTINAYYAYFTQQRGCVFPKNLSPYVEGFELRSYIPEADAVPLRLAAGDYCKSQSFDRDASAVKSYITTSCLVWLAYFIKS
jgi:hypothetical protein